MFFNDALVDFTQDEWQLLNHGQRLLHKDVMLENYERMFSLVKPGPPPAMPLLTACIFCLRNQTTIACHEFWA